MQETLSAEKHEFILLATDGLWDVMDEEQALRFVRKVAKKYGRKQVAKFLVETATKRGSNDNVTIIVMFLDNKSNSGRQEPEGETKNLGKDVSTEHGGAVPDGNGAATNAPGEKVEKKKKKAKRKKSKTDPEAPTANEPAQDRKEEEEENPEAAPKPKEKKKKKQDHHTEDKPKKKKKKSEKDGESTKKKKTKKTKGD